MNPLVQALSRGKTNGSEDYGGDLHTRKSTHISVPTESAEFHFSAGDLNVPAQVNQTYVVCFPVVCSSSDSHDVRFKQVGKPYLDDKPVFGNEDDANEPSKPPLIRTVTENEP
jgi:hypothetical protein